MKPALRPAFLAVALLLHAGLLFSIYAGLEKEQDRPVKPPLAVRIIPAQNAAQSAAVPASQPLQPASPSAPKKTAKPAPIAKNKPRRSIGKMPESASPATASRALTEIEPPDLPTTNASPPPVTVSPVKTDVSIPASYASTNRKPEYPALSKRYGEQGTVILRVFVREDGAAGDIQLKVSSGFPLLDKSAITAVKTWRFNPATLDGKPVAEWYQVPIPFKLEQ